MYLLAAKMGRGGRIKILSFHDAAAAPPPPPPPAPFIFSFSVNLGFGDDLFAPLGSTAPFVDEAEDSPEGESGVGAVLFTISILFGGLRKGREADGGGLAAVLELELELGLDLGVDWALAPPVGGGCWTWSLSFRGGGRGMEVGMRRGGKGLVRMRLVFWKTSVA